MTYSIVAFDEETRELGVGVQTHRPAVGSIVPWVEGGVGAVATQASANARYGSQALELLKKGLDAEHALAAVLAGDDDRELRQVAIVDSRGMVAAFTGSMALEAKGSVQGKGFSCQANMMLGSGVPEAMASAFDASFVSGESLDRRILGALDAAQAAGGDVRGMQSVALQVRPAEGSVGPVTRLTLPGTDFRVDHAADPLRELRSLMDNRDAEQLMGSDDVTDSLERARREFSRAKSMVLHDEMAFWYAVRTLSMKHQQHDEAIALLVPIMEKNPNWAVLMQRLPELPQDSPLRARFPSSG
jgi:uncharacterized Ntn-hydrolase superfamily protein